MDCSPVMPGPGDGCAEAAAVAGDGRLQAKHWHWAPKQHSSRETSWQALVPVLKEKEKKETGKNHRTTR